MHSQLSEVHHVLCGRDIAALSEEGERIDPDDASGAALRTVLQGVADRWSVSGCAQNRLAPDQWGLHIDVWSKYDPLLSLSQKT